MPCEYYAGDCEEHPECQLQQDPGITFCMNRLPVDKLADTVPCDELTSAQACATERSCQWVANVSACFKQGHVLQCSDYVSGPEPCNQDERCSFSTDLNACLDRGLAPPCRMLLDTRCHATPYCRFDDHTQSCVPIDQDHRTLPCDEHQTEASCRGARPHGCAWTSGICHHVHQEFPCAKLKGKLACEREVIAGC